MAGELDFLKMQFGQVPTDPSQGFSLLRQPMPEKTPLEASLDAAKKSLKASGVKGVKTKELKPFVEDVLNKAKANPAEAEALASNPATIEYLRKRMDELSKANAATEQAGIEDYQAAMDEYKSQPQNMDFTPIAGLVDKWAGDSSGSLSKAAAAHVGESLADRQKNMIALNERLQSMKTSMGKNQYQNLKDQLDSLIDEERAKNNAKLFQSQDRAENRELRKEDALRKDIGKVSDEFSATQNQLNLAEKAVNDGDTRTIQMVVSSIARNIGDQKGSLSDGDVARTMPPDIATSVAGLEAYLGSNAKISPELQGAFLRLINLSRNKSKAIYDNALARREKAYKSGAYKTLTAPGQVGDVILEEAKKLGAPAEQAPVAPGTGGGITPEQRKRLEDLRAKKAAGQL
jgi:molybdopterin converting factor small subunit